MELKLKKLIDNVVALSNLQSIDSNNSIVVRLTNVFTSNITTFVCSQKEPTQLILPLHVTWIVSDSNSNLFMQALVRVDKTNVANDSFGQHWTIATRYDQVMVEDEYAIDDSALLDAEPLGFATKTKAGLVKLSCESEAVDGNGHIIPIAVGTNDYRLSDDRTPVAHTHPPIPAVSFATTQTLADGSGNVIEIKKMVGTATDNLGKVLKIVSVSPLRAEWVQLTAADFPTV